MSRIGRPGLALVPLARHNAMWATGRRLLTTAIARTAPTTGTVLTARRRTTAIEAILLHDPVHRDRVVIPLRAPTLLRTRLLRTRLRRIVPAEAVPMAAVVDRTAAVIAKTISDQTQGPFRTIRSGPSSFFLTRLAPLATTRSLPTTLYLVVCYT